MSEPSHPAFIEMTTELVSAYVAKNSVPVADLPALIRSVHGALEGLGRIEPAVVDAEPLKPAVPVKKSITDEYIISLEDGRKLKSMKRYLTGLGMTPADYRAKWGLPKDYPMVAPAYAAKRSVLAKTIGLGRRGAQDAIEASPETDDESPDVEAQPEPAAPKKAGRGRKYA